jgi:triosephosphate isomerase
VRRKGQAAARRFVKEQLRKDLKNFPKKNSKLLIAYEPIWSISTSGTGKKDTPEDAVEMIAFIKGLYKSRVLYGGSVSGKSAAGFLAHKEIDGLLVGHASLSTEDFGKILIDA